MNSLDSKMRQPADRDSLDRDNLRLGLILGAVALAFFFGYMFHDWWLR